jgi:hypothetical protein
MFIYVVAVNVVLCCALEILRCEREKLRRANGNEKIIKKTMSDLRLRCLEVKLKNLTSSIRCVIKSCEISSLKSIKNSKLFHNRRRLATKTKRR